MHAKITTTPKKRAETNLVSVQSRSKNVLFMLDINRTSARCSGIEILFPVGGLFRAQFKSEHCRQRDVMMYDPPLVYAKDITSRQLQSR